MSFRTQKKVVAFTFLTSFLLLVQSLFAIEIFIYRPRKDKKPLAQEKRLSIHGELFGHLQFPSTFPSYNDLSGPEDRWNFGFQNLIFFTKNTFLLAQLVTHDDGHRRTKFDWHFSLRHLPFENLVLIMGHDSNHDSDRQSLVGGKPYYVNRNYVGFGIPFKTGIVYIEPFTWFFHNTNERGHLDLSGNKLRQEFGVRVGFWFREKYGFHLQIVSRSETLFALGQTFLSDLIIRIKLSDWIELSFGGGLWKDIVESRLGNKQNYYKLIWGIAIPF